MASKKIILKESQYEQLMINSILTESTVDDILKSREFEKKIKDAIAAAIKNDKSLEKDLEKKVKKVVTNCVSELFKTLWQRRSFYENMI